jgi:hypothetical protein
MANKFLSFIWYLITNPIKSTFTELKEFFDYLAKSKTWVGICAAVTIISLVVALVTQALGSTPDYRTTIFGAICFIVFYVTYQWRIFSDEYIHKQREKYKKV